MCNTVPNVIKKLGYKNPEGFTRKELLAALISDGYGIEKAQRRVVGAIMSNQIVGSPDDDCLFISIYCPYHWTAYEDVLKNVVISPVKVHRDGRVERI